MIAVTSYQRQAFALVLIFVLSAALFLIAGWFVAREHLHISEQSLNRDMAARIVADNNWLYSDGRMLDSNAVANTFDRYMSLNKAIEIYQLDHLGNIVAFSAEKDVVKRERINLEPILAMLDNTQPLPILGDDPRGSNHKKIFSATRLSTINTELGYLYVILRGQAVDIVERSIGDSWLARGLITALALSLGVGLLISLVIFRWLGKPLESLVGRVSSTSPQLSFVDQPVLVKNEIKTLESTFDSLNSRIQLQMDQIQHQDRMRRTFIADLSHDLRTPLAIVNSILESLQIRFDRLSDSNRLDHIQTAKRQTVHLTGLVDALFQLARLESPSATLEIEAINLADLIQDVVHKHQLSCESAGVTLSASIGSELPLVNGNTALIERLLDNLISNAIAHTPTGGRIDIDTFIDSQWVVVSVLDNGSGIAESDRLHIFDAGYRSAISQTKQEGFVVPNQGAGLGLTIAKRIASLHHGQLTLKPSARGARFEFAFPL